MNVIGSGGCQSAMMSGMQGTRPSREEMAQKFQEQFVQDFGEEALASIQNTDGTINVEKLDDFMANQGIEKPSGPPPMAGGAGSGFGGESGQIDTEALLERFTADFGEDAAAEVTDDDGSLNFEKLKSFFDEQMGETEMRTMSPPGQRDEETLLEKLTADFGDEAVAEVTNDDGSINQDKLQSFLDEKMAAGEISPPSAPPPETTNLNLADMLGSNNQHSAQSPLMDKFFHSNGDTKDPLFSFYS